MTNPKIILITGSNSGLGLATAVLFAKNGHTLYASMRSLSKKDDLLAKAKEYKVTVRPVQLDVTDVDSINSCVGQIRKSPLTDTDFEIGK